MKFVPKHTNYIQKVRESFERQEFMKLIGATLIDVQPGYCEIQIPYQESLTQQHGFFHAGVISTIADNTAGYAGFSLMEESSSVLTVEFKINLMAPANGELLIGKSNVIKHGRTLTICKSDIFIVNNGKEKLCAVSQLTLIELKNSSDKKQHQ
ncbi:PaaI family thioesterase [Aquimarina sp. AU474]|uniref:PaaI family thioesterase n=1 Tax=Aquimarina sp. AU474 TaxID=2108529 RepID=UPI000D68B549|nr:PaaI family thioesterase [Aquimarina sp. AU474]